MLLLCERCGRPRPGVSTQNDDARPVGSPECGNCGHAEFRAVNPSDFPAVVPYTDDLTTITDEVSHYGDGFARYVDDLLCYADDLVSVALTLPPM